MHSTLADKLTDYLSGLRELKKTVTPPIGAVLIRESDRQEALNLCRMQGAFLLPATDHPDFVLGKLLSAMPNAVSVIDVRSQLPPKLLAALNNLANGLWGFKTAGSRQQVHPPGNRNGKIVLLLSPEQFDALPHQETVSSVCRLAYTPTP